MSAHQHMSTPSFDTYVGFLKRAAGGRKLAGWVGSTLGAIGRALKSEPASRIYGAGLGGATGYGVSNWSADHMGLSDDERKFSIPVSMALSAFMGNNAGARIKNTGKFMSGLKVVNSSVPKILAVDVGAGGAIMGVHRGGEYLQRQNDLTQKQLNAPSGGSGVTVNSPITNNIPASGASPATAAPAPAPEGLWNKTVDFAEKHPGVVLGGLLALPATAALYQLSRAAGVIGDQKSIRLSASLRKRRGQATDLNFGLAPYSAPKDVANTKPMAGRLQTAGGSDDDSYLDEE